MFAPFDDLDWKAIDRLVDEFPLAWVVSSRLNSTPLPLLPERKDDGTIASLLGHCGRRNLIVADLHANPRALVIFQGPAGYISPRLTSEPNWGPTWNYAAVRFVVDIEFVEEETPQAVERLLNRMEGSDSGCWTPANLGERYDAMVAQIIAFRARVCEVRPTFKLGQDERRPIFKEIVANLGDRQLAEWMEALADK
jgi:transcriptional regulator